MTHMEATEPPKAPGVGLIARDTIEAVRAGDLSVEDALALAVRQCRRDGVERQSAELAIRRILERVYSTP